jgi:hypothetical protein
MRVHLLHPEDLDDPNRRDGVVEQERRVSGVRRWLRSTAGAHTMLTGLLDR